MNSVSRWVALGIFLLICFSAAGIGARWTASSVRIWYPGLRKSSLTPPSWVFGPVWSVLYLLMALAAWLVWQKDGVRGSTVALTLFAVQLLLNVAWSGIFFGWRKPGVALVEIGVLWCAIAATTAVFTRHSPAAGWLMIPYLVWVGFASYLNLTIWWLNR